MAHNIRYAKRTHPLHYVCEGHLNHFLIIQPMQLPCQTHTKCTVLKGPTLPTPHKRGTQTTPNKTPPSRGTHNDNTHTEDRAQDILGRRPSPSPSLCLARKRKRDESVWCGRRGAGRPWGPSESELESCKVERVFVCVGIPSPEDANTEC